MDAQIQQQGMELQERDAQIGRQKSELQALRVHKNYNFTSCTVNIATLQYSLKAAAGRDEGST